VIGGALNTSTSVVNPASPAGTVNRPEDRKPFKRNLSTIALLPHHGDWVVFLQVSYSPFTFGHKFSKLETLIIKEVAPNMRENHALGVVYNPCAVL
jgi:hypothetical protein